MQPRYAYMPRYFFHTEDGRCFEDEEGLELPDLNAAQHAATRFLGDTLRNDYDKLWDTGDLKVIVQDNTGLTLFSIQATTIAAAATLHSSKAKA